MKNQWKRGEEERREEERREGLIWLLHRHDSDPMSLDPLLDSVVPTLLSLLMTSDPNGLQMMEMTWWKMEMELFYYFYWLGCLRRQFSEFNSSAIFILKQLKIMAENEKQLLQCNAMKESFSRWAFNHPSNSPQLIIRPILENVSIWMMIQDK